MIPTLERPLSPIPRRRMIVRKTRCFDYCFVFKISDVVRSTKKGLNVNRWKEIMNICQCVRLILVLVLERWLSELVVRTKWSKRHLAVSLNISAIVITAANRIRGRAALDVSTQVPCF